MVKRKKILFFQIKRQLKNKLGINLTNKGYDYDSI